MKAIIVGGFGRSGTTLLYKWLAANPNAVSVGNAESKLFTEPYGLSDLYRAFVSDYTYARGLVAANEFKILMTKHLVDSNFSGQASIIASLDSDSKNKYENEIYAYLNNIIRMEVPVSLSDAEFGIFTRSFVNNIVKLYTKRDVRDICFVEKTPHNALNPWIYQKIFKPLHFLWIVRDPRAVVYSTLKQTWGPNTIEGAIFYVKQVIKRYLDVRDTYAHFEIKLEDLVYRTSETVEIIQNFCSFGLDTSVMPARFDVIEDWRKHLSENELRYIENELSNEIDIFRYTKD